jgi:tripartite-type tricarboxylate transporter receptor subunit TctC
MKQLLPGLLCLAATVAVAQEPAWPSKPVRIVVPFSQGTGGDALARLVAPRLGERWKQPVIVDNRAGASGTIGSAQVASAAPDGYTLLLTVNTFTVSPALIRNLPYDPVKDFAGVGIFVVTSYAFAVNASLPAKDLDEFFALVRKQPGKLNYASPGNGTVHHLAVEMMKQRVGLDMQHVPYKESSGATLGTVSGEVQAMLMPIPTAGPHSQAGKLRVLAVTGSERSSLFSAAPTFSERGMEYMDAAQGWYAFMVPAKTPRTIVSRLNQDIRAAMDLPELRQFVAKQSMAPHPGTPEEMDKVIRTNVANWAKVVADGKIKAD